MSKTLIGIGLNYRYFMLLFQYIIKKGIGDVRLKKNKYLDLLSKQFSSPEEIITEIINLKSIQNLPKGTEHFVSDLHGEYDAFQHILRSGSGNVKEKIKDCFGRTLSKGQKNELATLIYYPERRLALIKEEITDDWYSNTIQQLITLVKFSATKYTRSKLRKTLPKRFAYLIEELLYQTDQQGDKKAYYHEIVSEIIALKQADRLIIDLCYTIQQLVVDHLHVVGDIYDRGPAPDKIIERLMTYHSVDIQWGNHDIIWMGAAAGSPLCMLNTIRISARYNNLNIIEDTYGINLRPLLTYAEKYYEDNPAFRPKNISKGEAEEEVLETTKIHQAAAILQFKMEEQLVRRRPEFKMTHRLLLSATDYEALTVAIDGVSYPLTDTCFKTVDPSQPERLTGEEEDVIQRIMQNFIHSEKLKRHTDYLINNGTMYLVYNDNLLIHGCLPLNSDGSFKTLTIQSQTYAGKTLLDKFEHALRTAYEQPHVADDLATDLIWYLWSGECSSLFGKTKMTTFERYFIKDKSTHQEYKNAYYHLREDEQICRKILKEFGLSSEQSHIINGHTPVKEIKGENPIKANGRMLVIDGGFSKPYQKTTGLAGYTLLYNSYGMQLVAHKAFSSVEQAVRDHQDIVSVKRIVDRPLERKKVKDTTIGRGLQKEIDELETLLTYLQQQG